MYSVSDSNPPQLQSVSVWFVVVSGIALESQASDSHLLIRLSHLYTEEPVQLMA